MPEARPRVAFSLMVSMGCVVAALAAGGGLAACSVSLEAGVPEPTSPPVPPSPTPSASAPASTSSTPVPPPAKDSGTPPVKDASAPDAAPAPTFVTQGRWDVRDPLGPRAGWPGSKVRFRFRGTGADVTFVEAPGRGGPSEWDVSIDGQWQSAKLVTRAGKNTYPVAGTLALGDHSVELFRRTEGAGGTTQLLGVSIGQGTLLTPAAARSRTFEFLGDSLTNGYGIEGVGPRCSFTAGTQNFHASFASRVAAAFSADEIAVAYQGKGLTKNYERANTTLFPELYGRALPDDPTSLWDPRKSVPDAVFVMIGANDFLQEKTQVFDPPSLPAFQGAYENLLQRVRQNAPQAYVFAFVGPTQSDASPVNYGARTGQTSAVSQAVDARRTGGDLRVSFIDVPSEPLSELTACDYHPSVGVHERLAALLIPEVRRITGF